MSPAIHLSLAQARRLALTAQGFRDRKPAGAGDRRHVRRVFERVGLIQIDSVNVLVRSHYLPLFSRIGDYPRSLLDAMAYGRKRELFEYWGHEASLLPLRDFPLVRWRMERARRSEGMYKHVTSFAREKPQLVARVLRAIEAGGPAAASSFEGGKGVGSWWGWSETKVALEYLFWCGAITTARRQNFERVYDLTSRVIPAEFYDAPVPSEADAQRELVRIALRAYGVANERDLRDYFRLPTAEAKARIAELLESGEIVTASVEGWNGAAYAFANTTLRRGSGARALLSPFDSLVWERSRAQRLFGFEYRIEIYVPAHKRVHGYYVLPYLYDDRLVARADLKSDRATSTLLVHAVHLEPHATSDAVEALHEDLGKLATWLGLERVQGLAKRAKRR